MLYEVITAYFTAPNPPYGAVFTYYLKDELKTLRDQRLDSEKKKVDDKEHLAYPSSYNFV